MDWDFKMPPWDVAELDRDAEPGLGSVVLGSSGCGPGDRPRAVDCSVDLKLGGLGDFVPSQNWKDQPKLSPAASSSGTSKRPRAPGNGGQRVACLVDGCKADLSSCREYHRRHKVCEAHSKTPVVMVSGQEQRFCQQCSRFHLLVEFDEVKRSCRKRLDGHNRRRRKPQPDSMNSGNLFTCHQGTTFSAYPPIFPTSTSKSSWPGIVKTEDNALYAHCLPPHGINRNHNVSSTHSHSEQRKQFPFLQENDTTFSSSMMLGISVGQPHLRTSMPPGSSGGGSKIFSNGSAEVFDSDCALSLLSAPTQTSGINLGQVAQIPAAQPHVSSLHYGRLAPYLHPPVSDRATPAVFSCSGIEDEHRGTFLVSDVSDQFQSVFHVGGEGSSEGTSQSLPFCWQ